MMINLNDLTLPAFKASSFNCCKLSTGFWYFLQKLAEAQNSNPFKPSFREISERFFIDLVLIPVAGAS